MWSELREGIRLITSSPMLRTVVITAGVVMLGLGAVNVLLVPVAGLKVLMAAAARSLKLEP